MWLAERTLTTLVVPCFEDRSMASKRQTKRLGFLPVIVAGVVLTAGAWRGLTATSAPPVLFRTVPLEQGDLIVNISATGTVQPEEVVDVGAQVAGMISEFGPDPIDSTKVIDYGTVVQQGTVLARIDDAPYRAAVQRAQAQVEQAEAAIKQAEAQVLQAEANAQRAEADIEQLKAKLSLTELDLDRSSKLITGAAISASSYDTAKSSHESAQAALAVGRASFHQATAAIDDARANVARMRAALSEAKVTLETAEINLGYCTITSPVNGTIIDRRVNVGQTVVASLNTPSLFLIAKDLNKVQVWTSVNEADIGKVRKSLDVRFRVDAHPDNVYEGEVAQVRLNAMMTQNVVTYTVVVTADNSDGLLLPYLTANVDIKVDERENVLLVPNSALRWQPEKERIVPEYRDAMPANGGNVWIADGSSVRPVPVRTGLSDGSRTEISGEGLSETMQVVVGIAQIENAGGGGGNPFIPQLPGKKKP